MGSRRIPVGVTIILSCPVCEEDFRKVRETQKYCSRTCTSRSRSPECMQRPTKDVLERLMAIRRVDPSTGCWNYGGRLFHSGYGQFSLKTPEGWQNRLAHRVMWERVKGPIPDGLVVRHRCDNKRCFNPDHLELGTPAENRTDAIQRDLVPRGSRVGTSVLTEEAARAIKNSPLRGSALAKAYGVSRRTVWLIQKGLTWTHV